MQSSSSSSVMLSSWPTGARSPAADMAASRTPPWPAKSAAAASSASSRVNVRELLVLFGVLVSPTPLSLAAMLLAEKAAVSYVAACEVLMLLGVLVLPAPF